jgi:hypothetical protein
LWGPLLRIDKLAREGLRFLNMKMETQCTPNFRQNSKIGEL